MLRIWWWKWLKNYNQLIVFLCQRAVCTLALSMDAFFLNGIVLAETLEIKYYEFKLI